MAIAPWYLIMASKSAFRGVWSCSTLPDNCKLVLRGEVPDRPGINFVKKVVTSARGLTLAMKATLLHDAARRIKPHGITLRNIVNLTKGTHLQCLGVDSGSRDANAER